MTDANDNQATMLSLDDEMVLQILAKAWQQYEQYLEIIQSARLVTLEEPIVPPSPDISLDLVIFSDKEALDKLGSIPNKELHKNLRLLSLKRLQETGSIRGDRHVIFYNSFFLQRLQDPRLG